VAKKPQPPASWTRLRAVLDAQGLPPIAFKLHNGTVIFEADTGGRGLPARLLHDDSMRAFRSLHQMKAQARSVS
jgi:hypothetical protein